MGAEETEAMLARCARHQATTISPLTEHEAEQVRGRADPALASTSFLSPSDPGVEGHRPLEPKP